MGRPFGLSGHNRAARWAEEEQRPNDSLHPDLQAALVTRRQLTTASARESSAAVHDGCQHLNRFATAYRAIGSRPLVHSGRRTFITRAARVVHQAGGSLRDVQLLAGHRSIQTTQRYIDGDSDAQRRLVLLI
jgi:integrase/recombinase XerD